jgi:hypothetical protein
MQKTETTTETVEITFHDDYLHIRHPDNFVVLPEELDDLWQNLAKACQAHDCRRVLNEGNLDFSKLRAFDSFTAGSQAGEIQGLRMACLFPNYKHDEKSAFFRTVAANRGAQIEFFTDRAEALRWLGVKTGE